MKKIFYIFFFLFALQSNAQNVSFNQFSLGHFRDIVPLENEMKEVIGYALIYEKGLDESETKMIREFVLLDSNLNKLTNGEFRLDYNKKLDYYSNEIKFHNSHLYISYKAYKDLDYLGLVYYTIDLKTKEIKSSKFFKEFEVVDTFDLANLKKVKPSFFQYAKFNLNTIGDGDEIYSLGKTGYYLSATQYDFLEFALYNSQFKNVLSFGKTEMYDGKIKEFSYGGIKNNELAYYFIETTDHKKLENQSILQEGIRKLNLKTGEEIFNFKYNSSLVNFSLPRLEQSNDKLFIVSQIKKRFSNQWRSVYMSPTLGIRRTILDNNGNVLFEKSLKLSEIFPEFIEENDDKDDNGFKYKIEEVYNFDDSSFCILFERYKSPIGPSNRIISDYFIVNFDDNGQVLNTTMLDKNNQYWDEPFLFSQVDKENKEVLFYYKDSNKAKQYEFDFVYINKVKDGKVTQDKIDIKSQNHSKQIKKAKYGHFLIIDYDNNKIPLGMRLELAN